MIAVGIADQSSELVVAVKLAVAADMLPVVAVDMLLVVAVVGKQAVAAVEELIVVAVEPDIVHFELIVEPEKLVVEK